MIIFLVKGPKLMLRLNLGCGDYPIKGWTNIDLVQLPGVDVVADVCKLPYDDNSVDEIYAGHILEHISIRETNSTLKEWHRVLKPQGRITVTCPDFAWVCRSYLNGTLTAREASEAYLHVEFDRHFHRAVFDIADLTIDLLNAGFVDVKTVDGKKCKMLTAQVPWQIIVTGIKL